MERRKRPGDEEHASHERWLVSYADFMTLMFAFFVVMFASSKADQAKVATVSNAVARALEQGTLPPKVLQMIGREGKNPEGGIGSFTGLRNLSPDPEPGKAAELAPSLKQLTEELKEEIAQGRLVVSMEPRGLVISLKEAAFFPTGDATIALDGYGTIGKLANTIRKLPNPVRLEGHTDSIPIHNSRFRSNWELSAARSIAMLELLNTRFQIPAARLAVVGYGETIAVDTNDTPDGRARNRRVDVTILNETATVQEPQSLASK